MINERHRDSIISDYITSRLPLGWRCNAYWMGFYYYFEAVSPRGERDGFCEEIA